MTDEQQTPWEKLGVAAALAKSYAADQHEFLPLLAGLLEETFPPDQLSIVRKPIRLFSSEKKIVGIELSLGEDSYALSIGPDGQRLTATHKKVVRGVTLKTESTPVATWLNLVGAKIQQLAEQNEQTFNALQNFLEFKNI